MLKNWAIYRYEAAGKLRYLGVVSATGQEDAMSKGIKLLPEENPEALLRQAVGRGASVTTEHPMTKRIQ
jgi:hypothetical protein